jgi:hypothetical protein
LAGYEESPSDDNKQQRVLNAIRHADDDTAKLIVEELLNVLRSGGYFDPPGDFSVEDPKVESLRTAFKRRGYNLTEGGYADWSPQDQRQAPPPKTQAAVAAVASPEKVAPEVVTIPTVGLLVSSLRRLASALRPLVKRRRGAME